METTIVVDDARTREAQTKGEAVLAQARTFSAIETVEVRDAAVSFVRGVCKPACDFVDELLGDATKKAHETHKALVARSKSLKAPFLEAESIAKSGIAAYEDAERRKRAEEQRRLEEERRKVEAERQRLIREAEAKARREAEEKRLAEAAALEAQGKAEEAEKALSAPVVVAPPKVELPEIPKPVVIPAQRAMEGAGTRAVWKFRVVDAALVPRDYMKVDEVAIGQVVRAMKDKTSIPGVEAYPETVVSMR